MKVETLRQTNFLGPGPEPPFAKCNGLRWQNLRGITPNPGRGVCTSFVRAGGLAISGSRYVVKAGALMLGNIDNFLETRVIESNIFAQNTNIVGHIQHHLGGQFAN